MNQQFRIAPFHGSGSVPKDHLGFCVVPVVQHRVHILRSCSCNGQLCWTLLVLTAVRGMPTFDRRRREEIVLHLLNLLWKIRDRLQNARQILQDHFTKFGWHDDTLDGFDEIVAFSSTHIDEKGGVRLPPLLSICDKVSLYRVYGCEARSFHVVAAHEVVKGFSLFRMCL